jgi:zinc protease
MSSFAFLAFAAVRLSLAALLFVLVVAAGRPAHAMKIQEVTSPGGVKAWLVEERKVPLMALRFAFEGGNTQDPAGKEGLANFLSGMMDEGAGALNSIQFQSRMEELAVRLSFEDGRDSLYGSFETLTENRQAAIELLKLAVNQPRFDAEAVERVRTQLLASLVYAARDPDRVAGETWNATAFAGHPYGRPAKGNDVSVKAITRDDLDAFRKRLFAKNNLRVVAVGDIDAKTLGVLLDDVFGALPAKADLVPVAKTAPKAVEKQKVVEMNVPQSVARFGLGAMPRKDKDFMAAFVLNQIIGGGGFASRLMEEVREKRGLAYSVYSYIQPYDHASIFGGGVATKNEEIGQSLEVIRGELKKIADVGPTQTEVDNAKSFLMGSFALRFDTNAKIANQLLWMQQEGLGIGYVDERNKLIEAVTLDDVKRVAKRLLVVDDLIVTIVGKPKGLAGSKL